MPILLTGHLTGPLGRIAPLKSHVLGRAENNKPREQGRELLCALAAELRRPELHGAHQPRSRQRRWRQRGVESARQGLELADGGSSADSPLHSRAAVP